MQIFSCVGHKKKCNTIRFTNKTTSIEYFDGIHEVLLYGIGDNIKSLVHTGKFGVISKTYTETMGYYVVKFLSNTVTLQ